MKSFKLTAFLLGMAMTTLAGAQSEPKEPKLTGTVIGSTYSVDYGTGNESTTVNVKSNVFDGNYNTFFASYDRSGTWVGLDLGTPHVITGVGYSPRVNYQSRVQLAVIEGADSANFINAVPLYIIPSQGVNNRMSYATVNCSHGFRYVRYVTPNDVRCNLAELAFYGVEGKGSDSLYYQPAGLPLVVINTQEAQDIESRDNDIACQVYIVSRDGTKLLSDSNAAVRGRGNGSWEFPKKPYRLKFEKKHHVADSPAKAKKWTLINNYGDKTLMRNILFFEMSRLLGMTYTPFCTPVDVVLNGEYRGCYQLSDQVEVNDNRVNITPMDSTDNSLPNLSGGYFVEIDAYAYQETSSFTSNNGTPVTIKYPKEDDITWDQRDYIQDYYNKFEAAVFASGYSNLTTGYRKYLDTESFLKHFIVGELSGNTDTYWSTFLYKDRGSDKFFVGPVWDCDLGFDNDNRTYPIDNLGDYIYASNGSVASESTRNLVNRIIKGDLYNHKELSVLWTKARYTQNLNEEHFDSLIDKVAAQLDASQKLNFVRWPILNSYVHQNPMARGSYAAEVAALKSYLHTRFNRLDIMIGLDTEVRSSTQASGVVAVCAGGVTLCGFEMDDRYAVYDVQGMCVARGSCSEGFVGLSAGLYIVKVSNGFSGKFRVK